MARIRGLAPWPERFVLVQAPAFEAAAIEHGAEVNAVSRGEGSALMNAVARGHTDIAELLDRVSDLLSVQDAELWWTQVMEGPDAETRTVVPAGIESPTSMLSRPSRSRVPSASGSATPAKRFR